MIFLLKNFTYLSFTFNSRIRLRKPEYFFSSRYRSFIICVFSCSIITVVIAVGLFKFIFFQSIWTANPFNSFQKPIKATFPATFISIEFLIIDRIYHVYWTRFIIYYDIPETNPSCQCKIYRLVHTIRTIMVSAHFEYIGQRVKRLHAI